VWKLVAEVWVGSILFAIIFAPAVGLDLAVRWLRTSSGAAVAEERSWLISTRFSVILRRPRFSHFESISDRFSLGCVS
jgi:hypothetical protein